ncbi:MAG: hypothetical protein ABI605_11010 [Rhizobacter sp.]
MNPWLLLIIVTCCYAAKKALNWLATKLPPDDRTDSEWLDAQW